MEKSNRDKFHSKTNNFKEQKMEKLSSFEPEKQKRSNRSLHKKKPDLERDKQKAEFERSEKELKKLLVQFGSKARVSDDIDRDTSKVRDNIFKLMEKTKAKSLNVNAKPLQSFYQSYEKVYCRINWIWFLSVIILIELLILGLILKIKYRNYHYLEPYEAIVHGTFGVEPSFWSYITVICDTVVDFLGEFRQGSRSFGSPSYDGLVPI
ncbi:4814_t:CDS:2 [Funneliformis caledonium]|uniref:4814_t:CDS:1 n=1 Tax=Funneliformis caledonium TaxID=1117310 RepID=A0A9N8W723_9GLOM|nr:4814_t:CDS:2 [Funneliformis caledonium]